MIRQRLSPVFLLPVGAAFACFMEPYDDRLFMPACFVAILSSYLHSWNAPAPSMRRWPLFVVLGVAGFLVGYIYNAAVLSPSASLQPLERRFWAQPGVIAALSVLFGLALVYLWHVKAQAGRGKSLILAFSGFIAISSGNFHITFETRYLGLLALYFTSTMAAVMFGGSDHGEGRGLRGQYLSKWAVITYASFVVVGLGTASLGILLRTVEKSIWKLSEGSFLVELPDFANGASFGGHMRIDRRSRLRKSGTIIATVKSARQPGYLRTQIMTTYEAGVWRTSKTPPEPLAASLTPDGALWRTELPWACAGAADEAGGNRSDERDDPGTRFAFRLLADFAGSVPLPYDASALGTAEPTEFSHTGGGIIQSGSSTLSGYVAQICPEASVEAAGIGESVSSARRDPAQAGEEGMVAAALQAPAEVLEQLRPLALEVAGRAWSNPMEAAERIQIYFRRNYEYSYTVNLAEEGDPVVDFVLNRRPAYCEYYAAGMVLMLRSIGIPARVAGGFAITDYNGIARQWVVRKSDAHAWCEVFDASTGRWRAFDGTPPSEIESFSQGGLFAFARQVREWLKLSADALFARAVSAEPRTWLQARSKALRQALEGTPGKAILAAAGFALALGLFKKRVRSLLRILFAGRRRGKSAAAQTAVDPVKAEVRMLFHKVAAALEERGHPIGSWETASDYMDRVRGSAAKGAVAGGRSTQAPDPWLLADLHEFFQGYATLRFTPAGSAQPQDILAKRLESLRDTVRKVAGKDRP